MKRKLLFPSLEIIPVRNNDGLETCGAYRDRIGQILDLFQIELIRFVNVWNITKRFKSEPLVFRLSGFRVPFTEITVGKDCMGR